MLICRSSRTNMLMRCPICGPQKIGNRRRKLRKKTPRVCVLFELSIFPDVRLAQAAVKSSRTSQRCHKEGPEMRPRASQKHFAEHLLRFSEGTAPSFCNFGAKNHAPEAMLLVFCGKQYFCQNRAPAVVGARFSRVGPSKNLSGERPRTA